MSGAVSAPRGANPSTKTQRLGDEVYAFLDRLAEIDPEVRATISIGERHIAPLDLHVELSVTMSAL